MNVCMYVYVQPVLGIKEIVAEDVNGPINSTTTVADIKQDPYNMPAGFTWCSIDVTDPHQVKLSIHPF